MSVRLWITTPPRLCDRCSYGQTMTRQGGAVKVHCRAVGTYVAPDIEACNGYMPMGSKPPTPWSLDDVRATIIDSRESPGQVL